MKFLLVLFAPIAFAAAPNCKFAAFKASNPVTPSTIKQPNSECTDQLQHYSNFLAFGKTLANGCSDWEWAEKLVKSYGKQIKTEGVLFDEIPDLDSPLGKPVVKKEVFRLKLKDSPTGYQGAITSVLPSGARCALTVEIVRPGGVAAPIAKPVPSKSKKKKKKSS